MPDHVPGVLITATEIGTVPTAVKKRKRGRPPVTVHGTVTGVHPVSGRAVGWSDGRFSGDKGLAAAARRIVARDELLEVPGTGAYVEASAGTAVAAVAVISAVCGGPVAVLAGDVPVDALDGLRELALLDPADLFAALDDEVE